MRKILVLSVVLFVMVFLMGAGNAAEGAVPRPIEDFVDRQGRWCIPQDWNLAEAWYQSEPCTGDNSVLFVPPIANFIGFTDPEAELAMSVDYAGLADYWAGGIFGTKTEGIVIERRLEDGRAEVHVRLVTIKALTWVVDSPGDFNAELLFGHRAPDVVNDGKEPALGNSVLEVKFINDGPGEPLPDLLQLLILPEEGQELELLAIRAHANGPLQELYGVPAGTPGRATTVQSCSLVACTSEQITLRVLGH